MFTNQVIEFSLNLPCRCLSAVAPRSSSKLLSSWADSSNYVDDNDDFDNGLQDDEDANSSSTSHRFLISSAFPSLSKISEDADFDENNYGSKNHPIIEDDDDERANRLYLLQYHEDLHELSLESSWVHPTGEVWAMATHPQKSDIVATCGGGPVFRAGVELDKAAITSFRTNLWKCPESGSFSNNKKADYDSLSLSRNPDDDIDNISMGRKRSESSSTAYTSQSKLECLVTIPHGENLKVKSWNQRVGCILWNPLLYSPEETANSFSEEDGSLLTVGWEMHSPISLWKISSSNIAEEIWSSNTSESMSGVTSLRCAKNNRFTRFSAMNSALPRRVSWDPHEKLHILATSGVDVVAYDMRCRAGSSIGVIRSAHRYGVADVSHNHLLSNVVLTSGLDGVIKFWDIRVHLSNRNSSRYGEDEYAVTSDFSIERHIKDQSLILPSPSLLKAVRGGHSHWATRAMYNPFYDQLVLSGGSDGITNLWRISTCSSAPLLELDGEDEDNDNEPELMEDEVVDEEDTDYIANVRRGKEAKDEWSQQIKGAHDDCNMLVTNNVVPSQPLKDESAAHDIRITRSECSGTAVDVRWSTSDPWLYATLSYDGTLAVHHVPSKEKYKILL